MENYRVYERIYDATQVASFKKTKDAYGGLSNMAAGFPLTVNGIAILTSEALYQACRFPHLPEIQQLILNEKSPMTAKMVAKPYRAQSREDFENVKIDIMRWCLRVKLAQNFITFGKLLKSTQNKPIVEDSHKDAFWGAVSDKADDKVLRGINVLGRLLMQLRELYVENPYSKNLFYIEPLNIPNFTLLGEPIAIVDERERIINYLIHEFSLHSMMPSNDYPINIPTCYTKLPELILDVR